MGESTYLVEFNGNTKSLLLDLLGEMALNKKVAVTNVIEDDETLNAFGLTGGWYVTHAGTDYQAAERVSGPTTLDLARLQACCRVEGFVVGVREPLP